MSHLDLSTLRGGECFRAVSKVPTKVRQGLPDGLLIVDDPDFGSIPPHRLSIGRVEPGAGIQVMRALGSN